jgi:hypothetical protein
MTRFATSTIALRDAASIHVHIHNSAASSILDNAKFGQAFEYHGGLVGRGSEEAAIIQLPH